MPRRATKQQVAVTIGLLAAVVAAGVWWAPHIWWSYLLSRNSVKVDPVKVIEMPAAKPTDGWFTCRVGPLTFKLPPSMADEAERSVANLPHALNLTTASQELTVMVPYEI